MFRFAGLVVVRGGRGAADRYRCVWGALTVFRPHWVCPAHGCVLSPSTLLRFPDALYGAGPALHAVPVFEYSTKARTRLGLRFMPSRLSSSGRQELDGRTLPGCARLLPSAVPASVPVGAGWVRLVSVLGSWALAATLPADFDHPLRKSLVRNWRPVCSLEGGAVSGAEFSPFPSPLPPASGRGWAGTPPASSSLNLLSPFVLRMAGSVFWPVNFLSLSLSHSLSCYLTLAPSDCPQGIWALSLS